MKQKRFVLVLILALVSGGLAGLLALNYLGERTPIAAAEAPKRQVVVAVRDMPLGSVVTERDIRLVDWPAGAVSANYFSAPSEVVGRGLITPVAADEPLMRPKLSSFEEGGGLPILIPEGMRALSIRVDQVVGVAGFVIPGTRVDVLLTLEPKEGSRQVETTTQLILQDIRTLAAGQTTTRDAEGTPQTVSVVTLLVDPEQAEKLTLASGEGRIQLALRNTLDGDTVSTPGIRVSSLLDPSARPSTSGRRVPVRRSTPSAPASQDAVVETIRGGQRTLSTFTPRRDQ